MTYPVNVYIPVQVENQWIPPLVLRVKNCCEPNTCRRILENSGQVPLLGIFLMDDHKTIVVPVTALITFQGLQCLLYLCILKTKTFSSPAFYASWLRQRYVDCSANGGLLKVPQKASAVLLDTVHRYQDYSPLTLYDLRLQMSQSCLPSKQKHIHVSDFSLSLSKIQ